MNNGAYEMVTELKRSPTVARNTGLRSTYNTAVVMLLHRNETQRDALAIVTAHGTRTTLLNGQTHIPAGRRSGMARSIFVGWMDEKWCGWWWGRLAIDGVFVGSRFICRW